MNIEETLKQFFDDGVDGVSFIPLDEDLNIDLRGFKYDKKSKYDTHEIGQVYHIVIYKMHDSGKIHHLDNFDAILTAPYVYISNLIKCDFFGIVTKKTKVSKKFINKLFDQIKVHKYEHEH